jgi:hypothetical protein
MAWVRRKRLEFIEFRLIWEGRLRRSALTTAFDISEQQASVDVAAYDAAAPGNLIYDVREKAYLRAKEFRPHFVEQLTDRFLLQLMAVQTGQIPRSETFFGELPPSKVAALPHEPTRWDVVMCVAQAIRQQREIEIEYTSLNPRSKMKRRVAPHALGHGSRRWHMRAWSREHNEFRDYTFDRLAAVRDAGPSSINPEWDVAWHKEFMLVLAPNPSLPDEIKRVIEKERKMRKGELRLSMPLALCFYLIVDLNLDLVDKVTYGEGDDNTVRPHRLQLVLQNSKDYRAAIEQAKIESAKLLNAIRS